MKRLASLLLCAILLLGFASIEATSEEFIAITPEIYTERFNVFMKAYFETNGMTPNPVELTLGGKDANGITQFSLDVQNGYIVGKAINGIVEEISLSVNDPMGFVMLLAGEIAVSNIPNPADGMDLDTMNAYILTDPKDDDISYTNGYKTQIMERFEDMIATKILITRIQQKYLLEFIK